MKKLFIPFKPSILPGVDQVGGKATSLFRFNNKGYCIPDFVVLTADFFQPWILQIKASSEWNAYINGLETGAPYPGSKINDICANFSYDEDQQEAISKMHNYLLAEGISLLAVRSSSPEEDLDGTSFAGIYETVLGVTEEKLESAIKTCFESALDERVIAYKNEHGYDITDPKIAVIIQEQIIAEVSGVAFSLNPVTNHYDEAVINANFGLGDTVVDGSVTPDQFIIDKITKTIQERSPGSKEISRYIKSGGGIETRHHPNIPDLCLDDDQVIEICSLVSRIEAELEKPVDIEWAYEEDQLYLLQARPITSYFQLPEEITTRPGERKRLYQDALLTEQGLVENLSPLGDGVFGMVAESMATTLGGDIGFAGEEWGIAFPAAGRIYGDIGRMMQLTGKKTIVGTIRSVDAVGAEILEDMDLSIYKPEGMLPSRNLIWNTFKMAYGGIPMLVKAFRSYRNPKAYLEYLLEENKKLEDFMLAEYEKHQPYDDFCRTLMVETIEYMNFIALPTLIASERARSSIKKQFKNEPQSVQDRVIYIEQAFQNNVTIEMGLLLHDLSQFQDVQQTETADEFVQKLDQGRFSPEFMQKWEQFIDRYGHRYPKEIDVAAPRYRERPDQIFLQLKTMGSASDPALTPRLVFELGIERRKATVEFLEEVMNEKGDRQVSRFQKRYRVLETFAAYREIPKFYIILAIDYIRRRTLTLAESWVNNGRLDTVEQVFNLTYEQVVQAEDDPGLDLRSLAEENSAYYDRFNRQLNPPSLIDSRGFIPSLPRRSGGQNELVGTPVSPGTVSGPVKLLKRADEKPVLPGDILVTVATDPGWTTLFLNAAGVLLETGGTLQHGASVARESCKPCIVGLDQITTRLEDGQLVEMDGSTGIVTILD